MLLIKKVSDFLIFETESVLHALQKINRNKKRLLFVVDEAGSLCGAFSDGDFRRWIVEGDGVDLEQPVSSVANKSAICLPEDSERSEIILAFGDGVDVIPLVDKLGRVTCIAARDGEGFIINGVAVSETAPAYIIAEIGNNHQGDIVLAKRLVDLAIASGADCVKFQMRNMDILYQSGAKKSENEDLGAQYTKDLLNKFQLSNEELLEVFDYVKCCGSTPLCTPWDLSSLQVLEEYGMPAYKVASADFTNIELLDALIVTGKPLICSTGMSTEEEIVKTVAYLKKAAANFVLLHCNSTYPTPFKDVNLAYLKSLKKIAGGMIGYSGHERGWEVPVASIPLGAKVIEKHFTIDKSMEGNDHKVSLLPEEFKAMVQAIRNVEESMGVAGKRLITQGEMINREVLAKSIHARTDIAVGEKITRDKLVIRNPGQGLQPLYIDKLVGRVAQRSYSAGDMFYDSDLSADKVVARDYSFSRPFGIPVRYHDYAELSRMSNLDFVEFHLSYQDMELELSSFFKEKQSIGFAVHSPELFAGDHLLNLCATDEGYRARSIVELNRVCDIARKLKNYFPSTGLPVVVVNAGGFSESGFLPVSLRQEMYDLVASSLSEINALGIQLAIQTMPPFPWHFGGQSYHNIFVDADEIVAFCKKTGVTVCYDVSHSMMACNYYGWELSEFSRKVLPYTSHLHIVDASGIDGEGVQIGKGDVNFSVLAADLNKFAGRVQFIPEVWQGHKNKGEGFWAGLEFLERYLG